MTEQLLFYVVCVHTRKRYVNHNKNCTLCGFRGERERELLEQ